MTASKPYRLICWRGDVVTLGTFAVFAEALTAYAASAEADKALLNDEQADDETSGLTFEEADAVFSLPATRAATAAELAEALSIAQVAA